MKPLLLAAALGISCTLSAASLTWDDSNSDNNWNTTSTNWNPGSVVWTNGDDAVFGGTGETVTIGSGISAASLIFNASAYTLSGATLTLSGSTPTVTVTNAGDSATLSAAISAAGTFTKAGAGTLILDAANTVGAVNVTAGTLAITGNYTGNRLSASATVTVQTGATVDIRADNPIPNGSLASAVSFVLNGGTLTSTGGSHTHLGNITLRDGGTLTTGTGAGTYDGERWKVWGDITVANTTGNTAVATISGNGLGLVNERTFDIANVTGDSAADLVVSAGLNNGENATGSLKKTGAGTLRLSSSANYTGSTTVSAGVLELNATNMFVGSHGTALKDTQVLVAEGAGTLVFTGSFESRIGNITLNNGGTLTSNRGLSSYDALLGNVESGAATVRVTGTGTATMNGSGGVHLQGIQNFDVADTTGDAAADLLVSLVLGDAGSQGGAAGGINKLGAGTMAISTNTTYTGGTTVSAGVLDLTGGGNAEGTIRGTATVNTGATLRLSTNDATGYNTDGTRLSVINLTGGTLHVNTDQTAGKNQTLGNAAINMTGGAITGIAGSNLDFYAGSSTLNSLASATTSTISGVKLSIRQTPGLTITVADGAAATDLLINSVIANNGSFTTAPLIKAGAGKLVLAGVNTYTGKTTVSAGTLEVTGTVRVNGAAGITVATGATLALNGTLKLTSGADTLVNNGTLTAGGILDLGGLFDSYNGGANGSYDLIGGNTATGSFSSIQGFNSSVWQSVNFDSATGKLNFTAVPEPSAYGLLGAGALAIAALGRRRKSAR